MPKKFITASIFTAPSSSSSSYDPSIKSAGSGGQKTIHSSGRGGMGNIRRFSASASGDNSSQLASRDSSSQSFNSSSKSTTEERKDDVSAPKGLEIDAALMVTGIKSSGRGGSGNISGVRKSLRTGAPSAMTTEKLEALESREREVLAAHRAKKQAQGAQVRTYGRGGLAIVITNSKSSKKSKLKIRGPIAATFGRTKVRRSQSLNSLRPSSSSSSPSDPQKQRIDKDTNREPIVESRASAPSRDTQERRLKPAASTSQLPAAPPPPTRSLPPIPPSRPPLDTITTELTKTLHKQPSSSVLSPSRDSKSSMPPPITSFMHQPTNGRSRSGSTSGGLAQKWDKLRHNASSPTTPLSPLQDTAGAHNLLPTPQQLQQQVRVRPAGRGAQWRLITHVREERRGMQRMLIEEQAWEYFGPEELKKEKDQTAKEAIEMKEMKRREKGKGRLFDRDIGLALRDQSIGVDAGYLSDG